MEQNVVVSDIRDVTRLKLYEKEVWFFDSNKLDEYSQKIEDYEKNNQEYRIFIEFGMQATSIEYKMKVIGIIDQFNANDKVGKIGISFFDNNMWNDELLQTIVDKYRNIFQVFIIDCGDDSQVHKYVQQLMKQSVIMKFRLIFNGQLYSDEKGMELIKQYNSILKQMQWMEWLEYKHQTIGMKGAQFDANVKKLIEYINSV